MKRYILIAILCILSTHAFSQKKIKGKYCDSFNHGFDVTCIEFFKNGRFSWQTQGDLGIYLKGKGDYILNNKVLILSFDQDSLNTKSKIAIDNIEGSEGETINIKLKIIDNYGQPLPGVRVIVSNDSLNKLYTNKQGFLNINNLIRSNEILQINTTNLMGYESYSFKLSPNMSKDIIVTLFPSQPKLISDKTYKYTILNRSKRKLRVKNPSSQVREFKRVEYEAKN